MTLSPAQSPDSILYKYDLKANKKEEILSIRTKIDSLSNNNFSPMRKNEIRQGHYHRMLEV